MIIELMNTDGVDVIYRYECQRCHKPEEHSDLEHVPTGWLIIAWQPANQKFGTQQKILCEMCSEEFATVITNGTQNQNRIPHQDQEDTIETPVSGQVY